MLKNNIKFKIFVLFIIVLVIVNIPKSIYIKVFEGFNEYRNIQSSYDTMISNFKNKDYYNKRKSQLINEVSSLNIEGEIYQEEIISLVSYLCLSNGIEIQNISFDSISFNWEDTEFTEANYDKSEEDFVGVLNLSVEFNSSMGKVLNLLDDMKNARENIAIPSMRILRLNDSTVSASIDINFYFINKDISGVVL